METVYSNSSSLSTLTPVREPPDENGECLDCREAMATAAHELKTPLAIMGGYLQLLLARKLGPLTPKQVEVLTEMRESGLRLSNFVQNLLAYTSMKVERFEMQYETADMNACIREIAELWAPRLHAKVIAFYFLPGEELRPFRFDWFKVQHIVSNLLDNAVKYTPSRGTVWMHTEPYFWERRVGQSMPPTDRRRRRLASPNCCRITVADTGPGIEASHQQEIFEEYVRLAQAESRAEGYGLGLAIARKLVQAAGGKIWVESEPGHGSKFSFLVPLNPARSPRKTGTQ